MHKFPRLSVFVLLAVILSAPIAAQEEDAQQEDANTEDAQATAAMKEQLAAVIKQQNAVVEQYNTIIRSLKKSEEMVKLDEAISAAQKELAAAESDNADVSAARDAEQQVRDAVKQAIEDKLQEHPAAGKMLQQIKTLKAQRIEQLWQVQLAKFQLEHSLSPVSRKLAGDDELAKLKQELKDSQSQQERAIAQEAYDELLAKKIAETEAGQRLQSTMEDASDAAQRLHESVVAIEQRLLPIRREIEKEENKRIQQAREEVEAALNNDRVKELRQKVNDAIKAYNTRVKELTAESEDATRLRKEYDGLSAEIKELRQKLLAKLEEPAP